MNFMPKIIITLISLSTHYCISFGNLTDAGSIQRVLDKDKHYFLESQKEIKAGATKIDALSKYVKSLRNINTDYCPRNFRYAFLEHVQAWENIIHQMKEKESSTFKSFFVGLFALFVGQPQFAIGVFLNELQEDGVDTSKVFTTWNQVEIEALKYDVQIGDN
ncbi:hypothetical protein B1J93_08805 [Leptospira kirschneri serovar Pomona]|uniref:Uncharacterized protein n=2 Tax=Leptospira kirschneri TaxID=29507 RepID=A0A1T1DQH3_9LEPT|nr:hypothetical protein B1J93_08805 [Leptospira kirschneri serovar Pomona]